MTIAGTHPYADKFPMLGEADLADLAESIRTNGLRQPVVVTDEGLILDGRNRAAACERIGVEPETVLYEGDDLAEYVIDCNVTRRNMSTGARAMATALVLAEDGRRENGRWQYGAIDSNDLGNSMAEYVRRAGIVLDFTPDAAQQVVDGDIALDAAFKQADQIRRSAEADKVRERELKKRRREEAKAEAERNAQIVADLTEAEQTSYLRLIESEQMTPAAAWAAYQEDTRKEREAQREQDEGRRRSCQHIAEALRFLNGADAAASFAADALPHQDRFLAEPMRITPDRLEQAEAFLAVLKKELS